MREHLRVASLGSDTPGATARAEGAGCFTGPWGKARRDGELTPPVSEFETEEPEASYTAWLQAKVAASLADPRPAIPHDEVMSEMDALISRIAELTRRLSSGGHSRDAISIPLDR